MKLLLCAIVIGLGTPLSVVHEPPQAEPEENQTTAGFEWLKQFEGDWATENNGTMNSRMIGKRWLISELSFQNGVFSVQTLGYDAEKKQFIGTWVDATSSHIWRYTGSLDATGKKLVLEAKGPDLNDPTKMRLYRDIYEFKSENEIAATSQQLDDKKQWKTFHESKMTREAK